MSDAAARALVAALAAIPDRGSATPGERAAAELVAGELRALGLAPRVERERAHGTHWWVYGPPAAAAALAGAAALHRPGRASRLLAVAVGALGAAAVAEDVEGRRRLLRSLLPDRGTTNVTAEAGPPDAARVLVVHAHHDAAHPGLMFRPVLANVDGPLPVVAQLAGGPAIVALGALLRSRALLRAGTVLAGALAALFADVGRRRAVPGANDDASGVAAVVLLAGALAASPPTRVRVLLLSTGAEESMLEGMSGWLRRHGPSLPPGTAFVSVDSLGWSVLGLRADERALLARPADPELARGLRDAAVALGLPLREGLRFAIPTDGHVAARAGFPAVNLCSVEPDGGYPGYHTPQDTPDRVRYGTVVAGAALLERLVRDLDAPAGP